MLIRYLWLGLLLLAVPGASRAQTPTDSVARQLDASLRRLLVSPLLRVVQVRAEMVQDLRDNRVARIPGLLDYLLHRIESVDSIGRLDKEERMLLLAAAAQYPQLLAQAVARPPYFGRNCRGPFPELPSDGLQQAAQAYVARHVDSLVLAARQVPLPPAEAAFLPLYLQALALGRRESASDSLNAGIRRFLGCHPTSGLAAVLKPYVRYTYVPSPITLGMGLAGGATFLQGGLGETFTNSPRIALFGEASWHRYLLYLRFAASDTHPRTTYNFGSTTWLPDQGLNVVQWELSAGYCLLETRRLRLAPFAGVSLLRFSPYTTKNGQIKPEANHGQWFGQPFTAGLTAEVKLSKERRFGPGPLADSDWAVQIRNGWRPATALSGPPLAGNIYFFEVGISGFSRLAGSRR